MGALNQMNRFIPTNLARLCAPLRPLLSKENEWDWGDEQEKAFQEIKRAIQQVTKIKHFQKNQPLRIMCDASKEGLGAVLQQKTEEEWQATLFASRFVTTFVQNYSITELELLAVVWAIKNFTNYVYGTQFEVVSDHKALTSILKRNRANKTYSSRLTRWVDRLLPFQFTVTHSPGRTIETADYLSKQPSPSNRINQVKAEELWNNWFTVNKNDYEKFVLDEQKRQEATNKPIREQMANERKVASESEWTAGNESESESELCKQERQTIKGIIASICNQASSVKMGSSSGSDVCDTSTIEFADRPPLKTPICYSINQVAIDSKM